MLGRNAGSRKMDGSAALCGRDTSQIEGNEMKSVLKFSAAAALVAALFAAPASAEEIKAGDLVISQAWSRATPNGAKIAGGYLTIENKGAGWIRLTGGSGCIVGKVKVNDRA